MKDGGIGTETQEKRYYVRCVEQIDGQVLHANQFDSLEAANAYVAEKMDWKCHLPLVYEVWQHELLSTHLTGASRGG